jgi:hypothetical protein
MWQGHPIRTPHQLSARGNSDGLGTNHYATGWCSISHLPLPESNVHSHCHCHCHSGSPSRVHTLSMHHGLNINLWPGRAALSPLSQQHASSHSRRRHSRVTLLWLEVDDARGHVFTMPTAWTSTTTYVAINHFCICILICASFALFLAAEMLDDLTAAERVARTHPNSPPRLPPLPFTDHAEEMSDAIRARTHRATANCSAAK